ncbi:LuxR C-terminal-related transcriptional regulator [Massilia sp. S19_KUP03_FR1]|uniref:LuxR C-terminal-related transcriptional regulator n=1 Tax=Massilia sp. S19_KUP03_FR1 TaxID=3025503 RepID=UPI002FCDB766
MPGSRREQQCHRPPARALDLAESTVKIHVRNVLKKRKLTSRVQAAVFAVEHCMLGRHACKVISSVLRSLCALSEWVRSLSK